MQRQTLATLKAFLRGMREFCSDFTTNCPGEEAAYDWGREIAHRLTLRHFKTA